MKRLLSILSLGALCAAQFISADVYYVNVDRSGKTKYIRKDLLVDWDKCIGTDLSKFGKKLKIGWFGIKRGVLFKLWDSTKDIKNARHNGQPLEGHVAHIDYMISKEPGLASKRSQIMWKLNKAKPHIEIIECIQQLQAQGAKLIIASNNDLESLQVKIQKLNRTLRKKGRKPLTYDGCYLAGSCPGIKNGKTPEGKPAGSVWRGKFTDEYFEKLFRFAETEFGCDRKNTLFIFVDDLKHNIDRACRVAKREGVALIAVHKNKSDKKIVLELHAALSTLDLHGVMPRLKRAGRSLK